MAKRSVRLLNPAPATCHHFRGVLAETCGAGIRYDEVRVNHAPMAGKIASMPCWPDSPLGLKCAHFRTSTPEEIRAEEREVDRALRKINAGVSPCCDAALVPVGDGWEACSACNDHVVSFYRSSEG